MLLVEKMVSIALRDQLIKSMIFQFLGLRSNAERVSQVLRYETESRQGGKKRERTGSEKNATASVESQRERDIT